MFKALKGKAASALDAAQSGSGSGGNAKREAELEAKVASLEKELEKKVRFSEVVKGSEAPLVANTTTTPFGPLCRMKPSRRHK